MYLLYLAIPIIQIITVVHAIRRGSGWLWIWLIMGFPLVGSAVYFIVEVMPDAGRIDTGALLNQLQPGRELQQLKDQLELADTVENRAALADYYVRAGQPLDAVELYRSCLQGVFQDDPVIMFKYSAALFAARLYDDTLVTLQKLAASHPDYEPPKRELLHAKTLDALGRATGAIRLYESILDTLGSEEARYRLGALLEQAGQKDKARSTYQDVIKRVKRFTSHHRKTQYEWFRLAQEGIVRLTTSDR